MKIVSTFLTMFLSLNLFAQESIKGLSYNSPQTVSSMLERLHANFGASWIYTNMDNVGMLVLAFILILISVFRTNIHIFTVPMIFGLILANIPAVAPNPASEFLLGLHKLGIESGFFPLILCMGTGAMIDIGPLLARPIFFFIGAVAQLSVFFIFMTLLAAAHYFGFNFSFFDIFAASIAGAFDGSIAIFMAGKLAPHLVGVISLSIIFTLAFATSIYPFFVKVFTNIDERKIKMQNLRFVGPQEKIFIPLAILGLTILILPSAAPLMGFFIFGIFLRESGVVKRLSETLQNGIVNLATILLGLGIGATLIPANIFTKEALLIFIVILCALIIGAAGGILAIRFLNFFLKSKINPLIGPSGVPFFPMSVRISQKMAHKFDTDNFILLHAAGVNAGGMISAIIIAGIFLAMSF